MKETKWWIRETKTVFVLGSEGRPAGLPPFSLQRWRPTGHNPPNGCFVVRWSIWAANRRNLAVGKTGQRLLCTLWPTESTTQLYVIPPDHKTSAAYHPSWPAANISGQQFAGMCPVWRHLTITENSVMEGEFLAAKDRMAREPDRSRAWRLTPNLEPSPMEVEGKFSRRRRSAAE